MKILKTLIVILLISSPSITFSQFEYYASNRVLNSINKYDEAGAFIEEFVAENAGGLSSPQEVLFHPDGFVLISSNLTNVILKFDLNTGDFIEVWNQGVVIRPTKMLIGPDNLLYVTQWGQTPTTSTVLKFNLDGTLVGPVNITTPTPLGMGMVWDNSGNFYLALFGLSTGEGSVKKFDSNGNFLETFIDSSVLDNPTYMWWDTNGDLLIEDWTAGKVFRFDSDGNYLEDHITGIDNPEGFAHLPNGNLLVVERGIDQISEFDTGGNYLGQWDSGTTLDDPNLLAMRDTNLSVPDHNISNVFVTPSVGVNFELIPDAVSNFKLLSVYNSSGQLIENITVEDRLFWSAGKHAEGLYFISATGENGVRFVQKIIVKR